MAIYRDSIQRVRDLLDAFILEAPDEFDIDLLIGRTPDDEVVVLIQIQGHKHMLTPMEATGLANSIERCMHADPNMMQTGIADLILLLRLGADEAQKIIEGKEKKRA